MCENSRIRYSFFQLKYQQTELMLHFRLKNIRVRMKAQSRPNVLSLDG